ncbi:MAG: DUF2569 domain-containing protein [Pseudomonadota bacterium]
MSNNELKGLGGWLILVGIGVVVSPFRLAYAYGPLYYSIFTDGTFQVLTNSASEAYHPLWGPLLVAEALYNSLIVLASVYLIYLFFSKHYLFPRLYITIVGVSLVFIPLDAWLGSFVITDEPMFDPATAQEFFRTLISGVIWIPYMLLSKRVKATFVENMPNKQLQSTAENVV